MDPMYAKFPWQSPYCAMYDNPCFLNDYYGMESQPVDGGCNKYSGAGNTTLILPEKAKILSKLIDYENDGKINYKGIVYEGKDGDIKEFSINGVKYSVRWGSDGTYKGYFNDKGERYINPKSESKSQKSQIPLERLKMDHQSIQNLSLRKEEIEKLKIQMEVEQDGSTITAMSGSLLITTELMLHIGINKVLEVNIPMFILMKKITKLMTKIHHPSLHQHLHPLQYKSRRELQL